MDHYTVHIIVTYNIIQLYFKKINYQKKKARKMSI